MSMNEGAADLREGGRWSLAQTLKNDVIWLFASAALFVVHRLSAETLARAGRALGVLVHSVAIGLRRRAQENVARAFPSAKASETRAIARASFVNLGENLARAFAAPVRLPMPESSRAVLRDALDEG